MLLLLFSGWGGGYIDEPISKILTGLQNADEVQMDRWILNVRRFNSGLTLCAKEFNYR